MPSSSLTEIVLLSLEVSTFSVLIASIVGIPLGAWLGLSPSRHLPTIRLVVHTGMALPPVVVGLALYMLLSRSGPLAWLEWLFTIRAMILAQVILLLPFVVGITLSSVAAVPGELPTQLRSLGASDAQIRWTILNEARAGVVLAVAAAFGRSISEVGAMLIVGGNIQHHTRTLTTAIVLETSRGEFAFAMVLGVVLLAIAVIVNFCILRLQGSGALRG